MRWIAAPLIFGFAITSHGQNMAYAFERTLPVDGRHNSFVKALPNGNFVVVTNGTTSATLYIVTRTNAVVASYNLTGYSGTALSLTDMDVDSGGNIVVSGASNTGGLGNGYLYKFNQAGALQWSRGIDTPGNGLSDSATRVALATDGSIFILGSYSGGMIQQSAIVKLDGAGTLLWRRRLDTFNAYSTEIQLTPDQNKVVVLQGYSPSPDTLAVANATSGAITFHKQMVYGGYANCMAVDNGFAYLGGHTERTNISSMFDANPAVFKISLTTGNQAGTAELGDTDYYEFAQGNSVRQILIDPSGNLTAHYNISQETFTGTSVSRLSPALAELAGNSFDKGSTQSSNADALILDPYNGNIALADRYYTATDRRFLMTRQNLGQVNLFQTELPDAPNAISTYMKNLAMNRGGDVLAVGTKENQRYWICFRMAPQAIADTKTARRNTPLVSNVLTNDRFVGGVTVRASAQPSHGTLSIDGATGDFVYTPANNYTGPDSFAYRLSKPGCSYSYAMVNLNVIP